MLTTRQNEILQFIRRHQAEQGVTPTVAEIQKEFSFSSPATVSDHLQALERKGSIRRQSGTARNIRLTDFSKPADFITVPLLGAIAAGYPAAAEALPDESLPLDAATFGLSRSGPAFALRVRGDSMVGAGIHDGDLVILQGGESPAPGDIVAALIDGETTLKRYVIRRGKPVLQAENPKYPELIPVEELMIQGIFRGLIRTTRP
ncbi:MAG: transcriptional repressor LexA [Terrimicrobiaceae bacterium]